MISTFRLATVTLLPPEQAKKIKGAFTKALSAEFKSHALRATINEHMLSGDTESDCLPHEIFKFQTHHIKPVSLGGDNSFNNMAWVHPVLHQWIHRHIDEEIRGLNVGDSRSIYLPIKAGLIWGLGE